jgi:uncharacterized protein YeaO (DUF488 family)
MAVRIVRLGLPRLRGEGLRLGTVRRPPRGVAKKDFPKRNFYDVWLPELAPSAELLAFAHGGLTPARWKQFARRYRREMTAATPQRLLTLLAALSKKTNFSVGCYCPDEAACHRSLLRELLVENGALLA